MTSLPTPSVVSIENAVRGHLIDRTGSEGLGQEGLLPRHWRFTRRNEATEDRYEKFLRVSHPSPDRRVAAGRVVGGQQPRSQRSRFSGGPPSPEAQLPALDDRQLQPTERGERGNSDDEAGVGVMLGTSL